jgi:hypothetical protein
MPNNLKNKDNTGHNHRPVDSSVESSRSLLEEMDEFTIAIDKIFSRLESETEIFAGTLVDSFTETESILAEIVKLISSIGSGGGGAAGSFLDLIPGGGLISGFVDLFTSFAGLFDIPAGHDTVNNYEQRDINNAAEIAANNITVIVNSEIEKTKAVKFFKNYYPVYKTREAHSEA